MKISISNKIVNVFFLAVTFVSTVSCQELYFERLHINEYELNTSLDMVSNLKNIQEVKGLKKDNSKTFELQDEIEFQNIKYDVTYYFYFVDDRLSTYWFYIKGDSDLYHRIVNEVSKDEKFDINLPKIRYRYYLKTSNGNVFFGYKPVLSPNEGVITGGKELDKNN